MQAAFRGAVGCCARDLTICNHDVRTLTRKCMKNVSKKFTVILHPLALPVCCAFEHLHIPQAAAELLRACRRHHCGNPCVRPQPPKSPALAPACPAAAPQSHPFTANSPHRGTSPFPIPPGALVARARLCRRTAQAPHVLSVAEELNDVAFQCTLVDESLVAADGHTFNREHIERGLKQHVQHLASQQRFCGCETAEPSGHLLQLVGLCACMTTPPVFHRQPQMRRHS